MLPKFNNHLLPLSLAISATLLTACNSDDADDLPIELIPAAAIVQTVAPDYSNSEVAYLDAETQQVFPCPQASAG